MRPVSAALMTIALAGCAASGTSGPATNPPQPSTTTISMAGTGAGGSLGSGTVAVTTTRDAGIVRAGFAAPPERVFAALQEVYPQVGVAVGTLDHSQRMVGNRRLDVSRRLGSRPLSTLLRCGVTSFGAPAADQHRIRLNVISTVRAGGEGSIVETVVQATATPVGQSSAVTCTSTGALEETIAKAAQLRLAGG